MTASTSERDADWETKVAQVLYDELTGRHTGSAWSDNAVLRPVQFRLEDPAPRDRQIRALLREAASLGFEVHYPTGDRWDLAQRLAAKVAQIP